MRVRVPRPVQGRSAFLPGFRPSRALRTKALDNVIGRAGRRRHDPRSELFPIILQAQPRDLPHVDGKVPSVQATLMLLVLFEGIDALPFIVGQLAVQI